MDFSRESQTSTNTSESVERENDSNSESLSTVYGRESLIFQIYVTFPVKYIDYLLANVADPFLLLFW